MDPEVEIPIQKRNYVRKPTEILLQLRTSSIGREPLKSLCEFFASEGYNLQLRRSPKKRYINQCLLKLSVQDALYPRKVAFVLESIGRVMNRSISPPIIVGYNPNAFAGGLPGTIKFESAVLRAGYNLGKKLGELVSK
jgi:hypothetical protein